MNEDSGNIFKNPMQPFTGLEQWVRRVKIPSGISLFMYDTGGEDRVPVLLLHGLGDEADTWRRVFPLIDPAFRAIAPDLPGFGRSDKQERKYTIPFFANTMIELLDFLSIPSAVLVGHSTGAIIAHQIAIEHPERVKRLILIGGSLVSENQRIDLGLLLFLIPGIGERLYIRLRKDPEAAYRSLEPYYNRLDDLPQEDRTFLFQRVNERVWSDGQRRGFFSTLRNLAGWVTSQQKTLPGRLKNWTLPTQVIWGENDRVNSVENAYALIQMIPSAKLIIVNGAGHNVQQEKPEIIAEAINQNLT